MLRSRRRNKTNHQRVGEFGSKAEARRYRELELLQVAKVVADLSPHPSFELNVNGIKIGKYTADSRYLDLLTGALVVEEVKGWKSRDYPLRKKLFKALYPQFEHREVKA